MTSFPSPPRHVSSPSPPSMTSLPIPPVIWSCPVPPLMTSLPLPPSITSLPSPPLMKSSPPPPVMVSCAPRPRMQSEPAVPTRLSLFAVPTMTFVPAGQHETSSPSVAVTTWGTVTLFPRASVSVQVIVCAPRTNVAGALTLNDTGPQALVAVGGWSEGLWHVVMTTGGGGGTTSGWSHVLRRGGAPDGVKADGVRPCVARFSPLWTNKAGPSCQGSGAATMSPWPDILPSQLILFCDVFWKRYAVQLVGVAPVRMNVPPPVPTR